MKIIYDNRKQAYVLDIVRRLVSGKRETLITHEPSEAFKFKEADEKKLREFENMLNYAEGDLEYRDLDNSKNDSLDLGSGDAIKAEWNGESYYFMINNYLFEGEYYFALTALDYPDKGMITTDGDGELEVAEYNEFFETVDKLIKNLRKHDYKNIEKVELEARVKHGTN